MVSIVEATPKEGQSLFVKFDDGTSGYIDLTTILPDAPLTRPLRDHDFFNRVQLYPGGDGVFWPNDFDLAADMLHNVLKGELVHE
jgi:hypothetical protein